MVGTAAVLGMTAVALEHLFQPLAATDHRSFIAAGEQRPMVQVMAKRHTGFIQRHGQVNQPLREGMAFIHHQPFKEIDERFPRLGLGWGSHAHG